VVVDHSDPDPAAGTLVPSRLQAVHAGRRTVPCSSVPGSKLSVVTTTPEFVR
jgi:hypothetical protein